MSTVILKVASLETSLADVRRAWETGQVVDQEEEKICFPYDRIHVEFDIDAAA